MSKNERRYSVMLTRSEIETILSYLDEVSQWNPESQPLIERLERRLVQMDTHEAQEKRFAGETEHENSGGI